MAVGSWLRKTILRAAIAVTRQRYAAAMVGRLTSDWSVSVQSADSEIRSSLRQLRARSRELGKNNDYIKAFYRLCETNIVGSAGFALQSRLKMGDVFDKANNDRIEEAFRDWSKPRHASIDRKFSFHTLLCLIARTLPQDGEVFIRKVNASNAYGYALQIIDADWFNEHYNEAELPNGNRVVMSVELDKWGAPVAYYAQNPNSDPYDTRYIERHRIPADELIHLFVPLRPGQTRGVPWAHTAMIKLNHLYGYEEATVVAARVAASQMGVVTQGHTDTNYTGDGDGDGDAPTLATEVQPGAIMNLPLGYDFKQFNPNHPHVNFGEFVKAMLRGVSSGLGVSYNGLANDLENVNYSSIRYGALEEREVWKRLHRFFIEHFLEDVFEAWIVRAVVRGQLNLPATKVGPAKLAARWRSRGWAWVDPLKDMQANELALGMGVTTLTRIAAENGEDFEEIIYERAEELKLINQLGLVLNDGTKTTTATVDADAHEDDKSTSGKQPVSNK